MNLTMINNSISYDQFNAINGILHVDKYVQNITIHAVQATVNRCCFHANVLTVQYVAKSYIFRSMLHLVQNMGREFDLEETSAFDNLGVMIDCSRNGVPKVSFIEKFIRYLAVMGYTSLQLYTEDTFEVDKEKYFGYLRGGYSKNDLKHLDKYAKEYGIELIPCVQTLAHLNGIFRWLPYAPINDVNDILFVGKDKTYELIDNIFKTIRECFSTNQINIGMDEAFLLGYGRYAEQHGNPNRIEMMKSHLNRVVKIAEKYHFDCAMWSDMYYRLAFNSYYDEACADFSEELLDSVPKNVKLIYWDYYSRNREHFEKIIEQHLKFNNEIWFAGGAWTWLGFLPNNSFSINAAESSVCACKAMGVKTYFLTMWGDNGDECAKFAILPTLVKTAEFAFGNFDSGNSDERFKIITGMDIDEFMLIEQADKIGNVTGAEFTDPTKYLLFNDCLLGALDTTVTINNGNEYAELSAKYIKHIDNREWGYIFSYIKALADVMEIKATIGIKSRELYRNGDKKKLLQFANGEYTELISRIEKFYKAFCVAWETEKKSIGLEVMDYRLGGLISRVRRCKQTIIDFCNGKILKIDELDNDLLDYFGNGEEYVKKLAYINEFSKIASANFF